MGAALLRRSRIGNCHQYGHCGKCPCCCDNSTLASGGSLTVVHRWDAYSNTDSGGSPVSCSAGVGTASVPITNTWEEFIGGNSCQDPGGCLCPDGITFVAQDEICPTVSIGDQVHPCQYLATAIAPGHALACTARPFFMGPNTAPGGGCTLLPYYLANFAFNCRCNLGPDPCADAGDGSIANPFGCSQSCGSNLAGWVGAGSFTTDESCAVPIPVGVLGYSFQFGSFICSSGRVLGPCNPCSGATCCQTAMCIPNAASLYAIPPCPGWSCCPLSIKFWLHDFLFPPFGFDYFDCATSSVHIWDDPLVFPSGEEVIAFGALDYAEIAIDATCTEYSGTDGAPAMMAARRGLTSQKSAIQKAKRSGGVEIQRYTGGVGSALKWVLGKLGFNSEEVSKVSWKASPGGCGCSQEADILDAIGIAQCERQKDAIARSLEHKAKAVGLSSKLTAGLRGIAHGIIVNPFSPYKGIVDLAIKRAKESQRAKP